jgi:hypothetical protein
MSDADARFEEFLRRELRLAASRIEPAADGLARIRQRLRAPHPAAVAWLIWLAAAVVRFLTIWLPDTVRWVSAEVAWPRLSRRLQPTAAPRLRGRRYRPAHSAARSRVRPAIVLSAAVVLAVLGGFALVQLPQTISAITTDGLSFITGGGGHSGGTGGGAPNGTASRLGSGAGTSNPSGSATASASPSKTCTPSASRSAKPRASSSESSSASTSTSPSPSPDPSPTPSASSPAPTPTPTITSTGGISPFNGPTTGLTGSLTGAAHLKAKVMLAPAQPGGTRQAGTSSSAAAGPC